MTDLATIIRKHALKNAFDHGKANAGAVVGKVIAEFPECKKDMKETMRLINGEISRIAKLDKKAVEQEMSAFQYTEKKEEKKSLEVPGAESGRVITRFPPEPSGYPHIGHAKAAYLDFEIAKQYNGKMVLRFDDTNPEKESQEFVEAIKEGLHWLGISYAGSETFTSDNLPRIYGCIEKLMEKNKAYVCTCSQEDISRGRSDMKPCSCRNLDSVEVQKRWKRMLAQGAEAFKEGEAIVRFKGDLSSDNTVMRDPSLARIIEARHFRQGTKYRVWPNYDLAVVYMDASEGITHPLRTKEYELRDELYFALFDELGFKRPVLVEISRLQIKNAPISKRLLKPLVEEKKVMGWDDPRLPTLKGLARRGIKPAALREFVLSFGLSKVESEPTWEALLAQNRKLLDPESPHYFFVADPVKLQVKGLEQKKIMLKKHPKKDLGEREVEVTEHLFIAKSDAAQIKAQDIFRLKDLCNVKLTKKGRSLSGQLMPDEMVERKIQWVNEANALGCEVMVPKDLLDDKGEFDPKSLEMEKGYCERSCGELAVGEIVQFERFGFCRLDKKENGKLTFIFTC